MLTFWVIPSEARIPPATAPAFVSELIDAVSGVPGVQSVSVDGGAPLAGTASSDPLHRGSPGAAPVGSAAGAAPLHRARTISPRLAFPSGGAGCSRDRMSTARRA